MFVGKEETGEVECNREDSDMTLRKSPTATEVTSILARVIILKRFFPVTNSEENSSKNLCIRFFDIYLCLDNSKKGIQSSTT